MTEVVYCSRSRMFVGLSSSAAFSWEQAQLKNTIKCDHAEIGRLFLTETSVNDQSVEKNKIAWLKIKAFMSFGLY